MTETQYEQARVIKGKLHSLNEDLKKYEVNSEKLLNSGITQLESKNGKWKNIDLKTITLDFSIKDFEFLNNARIEMLKLEINKLEADFKNIKAT